MERLFAICQRHRNCLRYRPKALLLGLDSADVHWLRGYCHLLAALGEMILAYDHERLFDHTAQLFFANPQTTFASLFAAKRDGSERAGPWNQEIILDAIAFIHLANFPLREPERLKTAHSHLLAMVQSSRKSWELIEAETDNDREWIPGPNQDSVVAGVAINKERLAAWRSFFDEAEGVLNGKKLIPFWRRGTEQGVNLAKVFTEPRDFDFVLWVQGSGRHALPREGRKNECRNLDRISACVRRPVHRLRDAAQLIIDEPIEPRSWILHIRMCVPSHSFVSTA